MAEMALSDVKVLDLTWYVAGPYCSKLLADYGAEVIKVEQPGGGDPARSSGPFFHDDPQPEKSGLFLHLNTNKRGVTLDIKTERGKHILRQLVRDVDIVVESFSPRVMASLELDYPSLAKINPRIVVTSISNFGQTGPYRDFKASELVLSAMGSAMKAVGQPDMEPLKLYGNALQHQAGAIAAAATMVALFAAEASGEGQHVDVSIFEALMGSIDRRATSLLGYQYIGDVQTRSGALGHTAGCPDGTYPCRDGYWDVMGGVMWWPRNFKMLGSPPELADPVFGTQEGQLDPERREQIFATVYPWAMQRTKHEIWEAAREARAVAAPLLTTEDLLESPHFQERGYFVEVDHPATGPVKYPGPPFWPSETPWQLRRPAPLLGQHNGAVYGELGYDRDDLVRLREAGVI